MFKLNSLTPLFTVTRSPLFSKSFSGARFLSNKTLSVRDLPKGTSPLEVRQLFETKLAVSGVRMPFDRFGRCRGFAFVEVTDANGPINLDELTGLQIRGASLSVQEANSELRNKDIHKVY